MATARKLEENLKDMFLQCKVCLDTLKSPKTLPCLHTFCSDCIAYYIEHNRIGHRKFACPICRRHIYVPQNGVEDFPDSFFVHNLTDLVEKASASPTVEDSAGNCGICKFKEEGTAATVVCIDCKINLCAGCGDTHRSAKVTENHTLLPYEQGTSNRENFCRIHRGETIKFYCETCNSCICLPCTFLDHKDHDIEDIKAVRERFSQDMGSLVQQSQDNIMQLIQAKNDMHDLENELFGRKEIVKSEIRRTSQELVRSIQEQEQSLLGKVDTFYDTPSVRKDIQKLERTIFRLESAHHFADQLLAPQTSPVAQIVNRGEAKENLTQALCYELPDMMHHGSKLEQYGHFLPGDATVHLGSLLHCTGELQTQAVAKYRPMIPSVRATYMCKVKAKDPDTIRRVEVLSLAFLPSGDLVVLVMTLGNRIKIYNRIGKALRDFGDDHELPKPSDMTITHDGHIAVSDETLKCIKVYDQYSNATKTIGSETNMFELPTSLTMDQLGKFLVCDKGKRAIIVVTSAGEIKATHKLQEVTCPQYICSQGNKIYICDNENNAVYAYSYSREELVFLAKLGVPDPENCLFLDCSGMCMNTQGNLIIADTLQDKLYIFNNKGEAGLIQMVGHQLMRPSCLALSSDGILAVSGQGVSLQPDSNTTNHIGLYRLVRADI